MSNPIREFAKQVLPARVRQWMRRQWSSPESPELQNYRQVAQIGRDSPNSWIRKSALIGGWLFSTEHEYLWDLATRSRAGDILEIGSWMGKSTCILAGACIDTAPGTIVICIDTFRMTGTPSQEVYHKKLVREDGTFYDFLTNAEKHGFASNIVPIATFSYRGIPVIKNPLRMAFVDGAHDRINCSRDVDLCLPLLNIGGILALHDTNDKEHWPEVDEYMHDVLLKSKSLRFLGTKGTISAFEKLA
jgi:hypothetical protein